MKKISDVVVGDTVYSITRGAQIVSAIYPDAEYPICAGGMSYSLDGKVLNVYQFPTIYAYPVKVVPVTYKYNVAYQEKHHLPQITSVKCSCEFTFFAERKHLNKNDLEWIEFIESSKEEDI